jgi:ABC-type transporter Mla MlaB component
MNPFHLESDKSGCRLRLSGAVTIEHVRDLHAALVAALSRECTLSIEAREVSRLDAAAVQVLIAAVRTASRTEIVEASVEWRRAFVRFGFEDSSLIPSLPS